MLEVILFIGILAIIMGTVMSIVIKTQEARIRQRSISDLEQRGTQILETFTKNIRRSETVLVPTAGQTGSILALQMALNGEYPTMFTQTATGNILFVQKNDEAELINSRVTVSKLIFRNIANTNVVLSFDLSTQIPLVKPITYTRHFDATATLFPDDQSQGGGCGSCTLPSCVSRSYQWYQCLIDTCTLSTSSFPC